MNKTIIGYIKSDYKKQPTLTEDENFLVENAYRKEHLKIVCEHGNEIIIGFISEYWDLGADISISGCKKCAEKWNLTPVHEENSEVMSGTIQ